MQRRRRHLVRPIRLLPSARRWGRRRHGAARNAAARCFHGPRPGPVRSPAARRMLDLMKLDVMRPRYVWSISTPLSTSARVASKSPTLAIPARRVWSRMAEAADHADRPPRLPGDRAVASSLPPASRSATWRASAAMFCSAPAALISATRRWAACNKREPGSGCAALEGIQPHACRARHQRALHRGLSGRFRAGPDRTRRDGARSSGRNGRTRPFRFARPAPHAAATPRIWRQLSTPGELITGLLRSGGAVDAKLALPQGSRPRNPIDFALASAAVALRPGGRRGARGTHRARWCRDGSVAGARGRGGAHQAKYSMSRPRSEAAEAAFASRNAHEHNAFKISLGKRTLVERPAPGRSDGDLTCRRAPEPNANMGSRDTAHRRSPQSDGRGALCRPTSRLANPRYACLVTSAIAKGRIAGFDLAAAAARAGRARHPDPRKYRTVACDSPSSSADGGHAGTTIRPLESDKIWHDGQIVAVVVAETYEAAREAAQRLARAITRRRRRRRRFDSHRCARSSRPTDALDAA